MLRSKLGVFSIVARLALGVGFVATFPRTCDSGAPTSAKTARSAPHGITIPFEVGKAEQAQDAPGELDEIAREACSNSSARLIVFGFANERMQFSDNLELARQRAESILRELVARSVPRERILLASAEATPEDDRPARCEVDLRDESGPREAFVSPRSIHNRVSPRCCTTHARRANRSPASAADTEAAPPVRSSGHCCPEPGLGMIPGHGSALRFR